MRKQRFDEYIRRFNERDETAFDEFLTPDMHMQNGTLEFTGVQGMKDHYGRIWPTFREELFPDRFVSDDVGAGWSVRHDKSSCGALCCASCGVRSAHVTLRRG